MSVLEEAWEDIRFKQENKTLIIGIVCPREQPRERASMFKMPEEKEREKTVAGKKNQIPQRKGSGRQERLQCGFCAAGPGPASARAGGSSGKVGGSNGPLLRPCTPSP